MNVNWTSLGAFAAGAALLVGYELLRPKTAMAATPPLTPPVQPPATPPMQQPPVQQPPMQQPPAQPATPSPTRSGYDLDSGDRLTVYVRGPRAQASTTNDELRETFRRLGYDVTVTSMGPGTPDLAYKTVEVTPGGATYESQRVPVELAGDARITGVTTAAGAPKGLVVS